MLSTLRVSTKSAALVFTLAVGWSWPAHAQMTGGPGLSSGTGSGTGAGGFTGVIRNRAGSMSGVGPGASGGDILRGRPVPPLPGSESRRAIDQFRAGRRRDFPQRPLLDPVHGDGRARRGARQPRYPTASRSDLLKNARLIATPEERSLALQRIANGAIGANQLTLAHQTLEEAITATSDVTIPLVRDQRLIAIVTSLNFSDRGPAARRQSVSRPCRRPRTPNAKPEALPKGRDSTVLIRMARLEWQRGVYLASIIGNPTYRNEMLYKVAESEASGQRHHRQRIPESARRSTLRSIDRAPGERPSRQSTDG